MPVSNYIYEPLNGSILAEVDESGLNVASYSVEPIGAVISQTRATITSYFHFDGVGNTRDLTNSSQAITDTRTYSAFGPIILQTGGTHFPFQYDGQRGSYYDVDLQEIVNDYISPYSPTNARFLSAGFYSSNGSMKSQYSITSPFTSSIVSSINIYNLTTCVFGRRTASRGGLHIQPGSTATDARAGFRQDPITLERFPVYVDPKCSDVEIETFFRIPNEVRFPMELPPIMPKEQIRPLPGTRQWEEYAKSCWQQYEYEKRKKSTCVCTCSTKSGRIRQFEDVLIALCSILPQTEVGTFFELLECSCEGGITEGKKKKRKRCRCTIRLMPDPERKKYNCPDRVYADNDDDDIRVCQKDAKESAPEECRKYYGHCGWVPNK